MRALLATWLISTACLPAPAPTAGPAPGSVPGDLLTDREVAKPLGLSVSCLRSWRYSGRGPMYCKLGGGPKAAVRYRRVDVEAFISGAAVQP